MNKDERITYEEFMIMFRNAPRMAYMLYDKAEDEIDKYKNVIDKIKEKGVMYYDPEYSKIYGELCYIPGANNTRTPVIVIDEDILELLEEVE